MLFFYITIQTIFTLTIHLNELLKLKIQRSSWVLFFCASVFVILYALCTNNEIFLFGKSMHLREVLYRGFLSIYGLFAPLYIWVFVILSKHLKFYQNISNYQKWTILLSTTLLAIPFYVLGFYGNLQWIIYVLPIGVLIALLVPIGFAVKQL